MKKNVLLLVLALVSTVTFAQVDCNEWNWPEDKSKAQEKNALYSDYLRADDYKNAKAPLFWLLKNVPSLHYSIYANGVKLYDNLVSNPDDPSKVDVYKDSVMLLYDKRAELCGKTEDILNRKMYDAYNYYKNDKDKYEFLFKGYQDLYGFAGNDIYNANLTFYMDATRRYYLTNKDNMSPEDVIAVYDNIQSVIDAKKAAGEDMSKPEEYVFKLFVATIDIDCDMIENTFGPKFEQNPNDIGLAENIFKLGFKFECLNSDLVSRAAQTIMTNNPQPGLAMFIAAKCLQNDDYACAEENYQRALEMSDDNLKKGEVYLKLAKMNARKGNKSAARNYATQAVSADPSLSSEAYTFIGDLYYGSYENCKEGKSRVYDRLVFLAAYEMYQKAGNSGGMSKAKEQFPSKEELFVEGKKVGDSMQLGCWVGKSVTLRTRD
ncbi:tetratricopeptide repeat protein [Marinigracilibium pacificum]|uniref:Tetratricopeptide repeat protein n=1 Tax=Marinigracilibium pacificum TaxID=2729599 RepID=A0A848IUK9_9BACT|nr:tetratricopeptide repeat protein [Marinigracilibium pacificum]NMM46878.1 tetratricopeptide repeat protein [Marinigracilibium pacificum]